VHMYTYKNIYTHIYKYMYKDFTEHLERAQCLPYVLKALHA